MLQKRYVCPHDVLRLHSCIMPTIGHGGLKQCAAIKGLTYSEQDRAISFEHKFYSHVNIYMLAMFYGPRTTR